MAETHTNRTQDRCFIELLQKPRRNRLSRYEKAGPYTDYLRYLR
jgi:hypothetical protein